MAKPTGRERHRTSVPKSALQLNLDHMQKKVTLKELLSEMVL